jgi:glutamine---fructose-6-phosphate transaminase (isomerizing)
MCGIVGGIAQREVSAILLEGLRRLEYRGYDSAGMATLAGRGDLRRLRTLGKVERLREKMEQTPLPGTLGVAHTRWATHGAPSANNAHPHVSHERCVVVHNGIIENHETLRRTQLAAGHAFTSETDTEVVVHAVYDEVIAGYGLVDAVRRTTRRLEGAYALGVIDAQDPDRLGRPASAARSSSASASGRTSSPRTSLPCSR